MEPLVIVLGSIAGSLIGTFVGITILYWKLRPLTGAELDLARGKLRSTEFSLSSVTAKLEEREQVLAAAEEKVRAAGVEVESLRQQLTGHEAKLQDGIKAVAESAREQVSNYETRIDADDRQIQELNGQVARLMAELDRMRNDFEQESSGRSTMEMQLSSEREQARMLASRIAELEAERSHFDLTLKEERQSAAKGIELLLMAQENLSRVFRPMVSEVPAETAKTNGHVLVAAAAGAPAA